jgi:hypothetical protein
MPSQQAILVRRLRYLGTQEALFGTAERAAPKSLPTLQYMDQGIAARQEPSQSHGSSRVSSSADTVAQPHRTASDFASNTAKHAIGHRLISIIRNAGGTWSNRLAQPVLVSLAAR